MSKKKKQQGGKGARGGVDVAEPAGESMPQGEMILASVIAIGFAAAIFFRPFVDGMVHPQLNPFFNWAFIVLFSLWAARAVFFRRAVRFSVPGFLITGYVAVAIITSFDAIDLDLTLHRLPLLVVSYFVFIMGVNAFPSRYSQALVVSALFAAIAGQALYSVIHVEYVLPRARQMLNENPALLSEFFQTNMMTPEIRHRLESNRAFGLFLFPNALAGFMLLGLPYAFLSGWHSWRTLREGAIPVEGPMGRGGSAGKDFAKLLPIVVGILLFFGFREGFALLRDVVLSSDPMGTSALQSGFVQNLFVYGLPLLIAVVFAGSVMKLGWRRGLVLLRGLFMPVVFVLALYALWLSGSRGGMLALIVTALLLAGLEVFRRSGSARRYGLVRAAGFVLLAGALLIPFGSTAQTEPLVDVDGMTESRPGLTDTSTMVLRVHYWRVALRMWFDHFLSGIGFGNFEAAYGSYQYPGAPYVQMAHNDFLQAFSETGVLGGLLFTGFWVYFAVYGAWSVLQRNTLRERLGLAGLYGSVLAFALHQFVDFGFQNPSLHVPAYFLAGLFYCRAGIPGGGGVTISNRAPVAAVVFLVLAAATAGGVGRVYVADQALSRVEPLSLRYNAAREILRHEVEPGEAPPTPNPIPARAITSFVSNSEKLKAMGFFVRPSPTSPGNYERIPVNQVMPRNALFVVRHLTRARVIATEAAHQWIPRFVEVDGGFPYRAELAYHIYSWYEMLIRHTGTRPERSVMARDAEKWAREFVERSPYNGWAYMVLGRALWMRAGNEFGADGLKPVYEEAEERLEAKWGDAGQPEGELPRDHKLRLYREGLHYFEKAVEHNAAVPEMYYEYAGRLDELATWIDDPAEEEALRQRAQGVRERAAEVAAASPF